MNKWKSIWSAIRDPKKVGYLLDYEQQRIRIARDMSFRLKKEKLLDGNLFGNPALHIGSALELAEKWHLMLSKGTCSSDCRAALHKNCWLKPLNRNVCSWNYGTFTLKDPDDVHEIYAFGRDIQRAVCQCLLNAREAGVI